MKLKSQTIYHQIKMTWKTFEETRPKQVYQSLTCEGWWWWWLSDMKNYSSLVHFKYPSVKDYLCTNLTRHGTSFSKALKHFIYVQTMLFAINQAVSCKPLSRKAQVQFQASPYGNCGGQSGSGTGFSSNTSQFSTVKSCHQCPILIHSLTLILHNLSNW